MSDGLDPRVNLISRQPGGKWRAIETDCGAMTLHAEADSLAELIAGPDAITLPIEQYGALVRDCRKACADYERVRDALELAKQGDAGAIAKAAKRETLAAVLALRETAELACVAPGERELDGWMAGVETYAELIEAEMAKL